MDTKERIINKAYELYSRFGIKRVTMTDICTELGMSKKTIYQYFKDKKSLVNSCMSEMMDKDCVMMDCISKEAENAIDMCFKMSNHMREALSNVNPVAYFDMKKFYPEIFESFQTHKEDVFCDTLVEMIEKGQKEGVFRKDLHVRLLARMRLAQIEWGFEYLNDYSDNVSVVDVQLTLFEHFIKGMATDKGLQLYNQYKEELTINN